MGIKLVSLFTSRNVFGEVRGLNKEIVTEWTRTETGTRDGVVSLVSIQYLFGCFSFQIAELELVCEFI